MRQPKIDSNDPIHPVDLDTETRGALWGRKIQDRGLKLCQLRGCSVVQCRAEPPLCQSLGKAINSGYA